MDGVLVVDKHWDMGYRGVDGGCGEGRAMFIYSDCLILLTCVLPTFLGSFIIGHQGVVSAPKCTRAVMPFRSDVSAVDLGWPRPTPPGGVVALCCSARHRTRGHL